MDRRHFLGGAAVGLTGCAGRVQRITPPAGSLPMLRLAPIRAEMERMFRVTVCLRPFRAAGPRLDVEKVGEKTVVHNYGHGGSGWSLSWGSSALAVEKAMAAGEREVGVIGCGALGLTSAILLQRAGAKVTIYAKERPPEVRSAWATGSWTPDSRVALSDAVSPDFPALWEKMCRTSYRMYQSFLGAPGNPIEWLDQYFVHQEGPARPAAPAADAPEELPFVHYIDRIRDITPKSRRMEPGTHPFPGEVSTGSRLTFHVASYARQLVHDFLVEGGRIVPREFHSPNELTALPEKVLIHATGYGARALWKDESIVPVRGQIAWLIPQPEVNYGVFYKGVFMLGRRDGIVVQSVGSGDMDGYNDTNETPDRPSAEAAIRVAAELAGKMRR